MRKRLLGSTTQVLISIALIAAVYLGVARSALAHELEIGGFAGARISDRGNELGRGDGDPRDNAAEHSAHLGLRLGYGPHPNVMFEGEVGLIPTRTFDHSATLLLLTYRAHLLVHILTGRWRPFLLIGGGATSSVYSSDTAVFTRDTDGLLHGGLGLKVGLTERVGLRLDGRVLFPPRISDNLFTQEYEVALGLYGRFGSRKRAPAPVDTDGDGVMDAQDECPKVPEDRDGFRDDDGCPDPDNDRDGIGDSIDQCPNEAGPINNQGCPPKDGDGDGLLDGEDRCPAQPGPMSNRGCPEPDTDGDGTLDREDRCPSEPGPMSNSGCPEKDRDGDGILDKDDRCPGEPETLNGFQDLDGCPDKLPRTLARFTGVIKGLNFAAGKDTILGSSFGILVRAAKVLKENPDVRVEISGHTDSQGDREKNIDLSRRRAEAVRRYLIDMGIEEGRLVAIGHGPDRPLAKNTSRAGRAKNRRVEFTLLVSK